MQREQEELAERSRVKKSPIELMKDLLIHMQPGEVIAKSMRRIVRLRHCRDSLLSHYLNITI